MTEYERAQDLCLRLLKADTEQQVVDILQAHGYWDDPRSWHPFGDKEGNFSTFGSQSNRADFALVEKLINAIDAVLMSECREAGIDPSSLEAPRSIAEAVAQFFVGDTSKADTLGHTYGWEKWRRRSVSDRITLAATGSRQKPSFTIVDDGEGQSPSTIPDTLLSLDQQNKVDVHFVQGKFNMGGTGALRFCGIHNLQLIVSRRNPRITSTDEADPWSDQWGFTIVRRENPSETRRVSTYKYLAPEASQLLHFCADTLPLFPEGNEAYARDCHWGTAIKLYEYQIKGRSHILRRDGLLQRLEVLLPEIAIPVRLHECRNYEGHAGSFDTTLGGLKVRLNDGGSESLEPGFPNSSTFTRFGERMTADIYAFRRDKADTYKRNEGIIFAVNGQTHGVLSKSFFSRRSVGMDRLRDSILVIVDCSHISGRKREDLFMNSRDRMEQGEFLASIESALESILKENQLLRNLREQRRRDDVEAKMRDSKPLRDALESIVRKSPSVAALLSGTGPLSDPFRSRKAKVDEAFSGRQYPSFFRFRDMDYGRRLHRTTAANMRSRIGFETDVRNDYFTRTDYPGRYVLRSSDLVCKPIPDYTFNLLNGIATLNLSLPSEAAVGDTIRYELVVQDDTLLEPFINEFDILVGACQERKSGTESNRLPPKEFQGLAIPEPIQVSQSEWQRYKLDKLSALKVIYDGADEDVNETGSHTYYINMDNVHLLNELKRTTEDVEIVKSRWIYGMVLIGLALLSDGDGSRTDDNGGIAEERADYRNREDEVYATTSAMAPVLLPLIEHLGGLSRETLT